MKKEQHDTEKALGDVSQVNGNPLFKKIVHQSGLALVILVCLGIIALMFKSPKKEEKPQTKTETSAAHQDILNKNLEMIEQMKKQREAIAAAIPDVSVRTEHLIKKEKSATRVSKEMMARINAPTTLIHNERSHAHAIDGGHADAQGIFLENNANSQFMNQQGDIAQVTARRLPHPALTVPAGEMIPATLGVAMNSELPGMILAVTERHIYSLTGENILIPRGSRLVGQYNSSVVQGQSRFLVVWNRVQLPNGVIVNLQSPGADSLGRSGLEADYIDRHFLQRFGTASLLSIIGAFAANQGVDPYAQYNSSAEYRAAMAASFNQTAQQTFERDSRIKPTLDKYQGAQITVFVARDLDFASVGRQVPPNVTMNQAVRARSAVWKQ